MYIKARILAPVMLAATLVLAGCQAPSHRAGGSAAGGQQNAIAPLDFFIAQTEPAAGLIQAPLNEGSVYLSRHAVLTRTDLTEAASLINRQGKYYVGLRFNEDGARKLSDLSTRNIGKLLALVIGGELVAAPRIAEPLTRGVLAFGVDSAQSADFIAARIRGENISPAAVTAATSMPAQ